MEITISRYHELRDLRLSDAQGLGSHGQLAVMPSDAPSVSHSPIAPGQATPCARADSRSKNIQKFRNPGSRNSTTSRCPGGDVGPSEQESARSNPRVSHRSLRNRGRNQVRGRLHGRAEARPRLPDSSATRPVHAVCATTLQAHGKEARRVAFALSFSEKLPFRIAWLRDAAFRHGSDVIMTVFQVTAWFRFLS